MGRSRPSSRLLADILAYILAIYNLRVGGLDRCCDPCGYSVCFMDVSGLEQSGEGQ